MELPQRHTQSLRAGRISLPNARYFVTCSAVRPCNYLVAETVAHRIKETWARMHLNGDIIPHCATIMPDHVHLLFTLTDRLKLSQAIGKFKALTGSSRAGFHNQWQENYFEHRLRPDERLNPFGRYIFMNPYRSKLIALDVEWPHWILDDATTFDFLAMLERGRFPPRAWMDLSLEQMGLTAGATGED